VTAYTYVLAAALLAISYLRDRKRTRQAVGKGLRSLANIIGEFSAVLIVVGIMLTVVSPQAISSLLGAQSGWVGMLLSSLLGSITLIPGFVAFPLAKSLLDRGAGVVQVAVLLSTLMMVGVVTLPIEIKYLGRKEALLRNGLAYIWSLIAALIIGWVVI